MVELSKQTELAVCVYVMKHKTCIMCIMKNKLAHIVIVQKGNTHHCTIV